MDLVQLFCEIDDHLKKLQNSKDDNFVISCKAKRGPKATMSLSEIMTIVIWYHSSGFRNFKAFYSYIRAHNKSEFNNFLSYSRFVEWIPYTLFPLLSFLKTKMGDVTGISFIDSTPIKVCHNKRIRRNRVFKGLAKRGKSSMGWFFGFKLHLVVNERGDLLSIKITRGNVDDRVPVRDISKRLFGKLYADRGYIGEKLFKDLFQNGVHLITGIRSNMKNKFLHVHDKLMLRKRSIIETINDQLKNISDIEHTRHRSPLNFLVNLVTGLISYTCKEKRPSIKGLPKNLITN